MELRSQLDSQLHAVAQSVFWLLARFDFCTDGSVAEFRAAAQLRAAFLIFVWMDFSLARTRRSYSITLTVQLSLIITILVRAGHRSGCGGAAKVRGATS